MSSGIGDKAKTGMMAILFTMHPNRTNINPKIGTMNPSAQLLSNALSSTNELLNELLVSPAIPADRKEQIKKRVNLNAIAISIAKIQEGETA